MKKLDKTALLVISATFCLLIIIILFSSLRPVNISCENTDCSLVNPWISISFEFSKAVDTNLVSQHWQTDPAIAGHWEWLDDRHATWQADDPLPSGQTVNLIFLAGPISEDGSELDKQQTWTVTVRDPQIITIQTINNSGQELFVTELNENAATEQITFTNGKIFNYAPAPDGERIIYSVENESGGMDLWLLNRDGSDNQKILDCASERCSTTSWSPVTLEVAYTRDNTSVDGDERIWLLNIDSGETAPLFDNTQKTGYGPKWSPDGKWLTYWNERESGIQIVERETGEIHLLESYNGDTGCWSPDSEILYYANTILGETAFHNVILKADIENGTIETIMGGNVDGSGLNYDNPECSTFNNLIAVCVQPNTNIPGKELSIIDMDTQDNISVINDLTRIPSFYSWTPSGEYLVFQLSEVKAAEEDIEIWIWDEENQRTQILLKGAKSPAWLP